jgi:hypothetical protein
MTCFVRPRVIRVFVVFAFSFGALFPELSAAAQEQSAAGAQVDAESLVETKLLIEFAGTQIGSGLGDWTRDPSDPNTAFNSKTGQNAVYDKNKRQWIDPRTGKGLSRAADDKTAEAIVETALLTEFAGTQIGSGLGDWTRDPSDPNTAFNSKTGQNAVYDKNKRQWIDAKTGTPLSPSAGNLTTPPVSTVPAPGKPETAPPAKNKTVSVSTPGQPAPPKPLFSMGVGGGLGFSNIGGTSGDRAAFLNSFPGGTFSTSANTFAGNVGSSLGIGPAVFDFNAWRANGSDSKGSGPVLGGGTDTAHITQQFQGISLTGGFKIPFGHGFSLIPMAGGNFWHVNIDTKETVTGTTSSTATNSRGVDGIGWTTGAALQVDLSPRWSTVFRWDHFSMNNAGVNVHLNQGSVGIMFRLFGVPGK